ncbi:hypothetical protein HNP25_001457 [Arcicella rosea]|uniref:Uncharacterized protein n=1 Tax=Arcicella rosea TaxID=502909 RepID=A0A841EI10_9BACT|nr:hypothetical protein [Arcicella rosea]
MNSIQDNYADSFKTDILFFFDELNESNQHLTFLNKLESFVEIEDWVDRLTSRIVLKFDEETEQLNDLINYFIQIG